MVLPSCNPRASFNNFMITGGPRPKDISVKPVLERICFKHFGHNIKRILVTEELSDKGYEHFHIGVVLCKILKWKSLFNDITCEIKRWMRDHDTGDQLANVRFHFASPKKAGKIYQDYFNDPKKDKTTDPNCTDKTDPQFHAFRPDVTTNVADTFFMDWVRDTKKPDAPVFHRLACQCELCV